MKQRKFYPASILPKILFFLTIISPNIVFAASTPITHHYDKAKHQLLLQWSGQAHANVAKKGGNVTLTFNQPIALQHPETLQQQSGGTVENIRYGYDKLQLTFAYGITPFVTASQGRVSIDLAGSTAMPQESLSTSLLKIRLLAEKGEAKKALAQLDALEQQHPGNKDIRILRADIQEQTGQWQNALDTYGTLMKSEPHNEDIQASYRAIALNHAPFAGADMEYRETGNSRTEFFTRAEGEMRVHGNIGVGLKIERNDLEADAAINPATNTLIRVDDDFYRGETYVTLDDPKGNTVKASLLVGEDDIGVGGRYMLRDTKGVTSFGAEYNAPNWDYLETVIAEGTRDRLIIGRTHHFTPRFTVTLQSGLNQYNLEDFDEAARSLSLDGAASYAITSEHHYADFLGKDANVDVRYTLDAEYMEDVKTAASPFGTYEPLPAVSREVHGLVLAVGKHITQPLLAEIYGGYAIDRLGEDGAKYGANVFLDVTDTVGLRAGYEHSISTELSGEDLDSVTGGLLAKF